MALEKFNFTNMTSAKELLVFSNTATNDLFVVSIITVFFMVMFISMKSRNTQTEKAFASSMFATTLLTYLMAIIPGFLNAAAITIMTILTAVSVLFLYKSERSGGY